ncbi:MAG: thioredoxin fold domain-containing protein [Bacteroidetes bacterium]|jgi:thiol:disulfide interchange protein DsbD|nr:thioredoxin fold domain-containing protein [Bacteroidota bacterium]MBT5530472.1 thioredoxin fold domain-containing protein [Cytophagia bacterium]MBT3423117.1 thioredoxin fold domain-containing protein [Bacteroidota bacterium]MBT3800942.1 thioredoxin fold domain-containing protein [Bacteroidota bacterium]MBT3935825.1 thioredoxin fold domain-containing protein [Bacteroidota bacterium]
MAKSKLLLIITLFLLTSTSVFSQMQDPVNWTFEIKAIVNDQYELVMTAKIDDKWHLYSQDIASDDPDAITPVPTSFNFDDNPDIEFIGKVEERSEVHSDYDENFDMILKSFMHKAVFVQKIKIKNVSKVTGYLEFMACDDKQCLSPKEIDFEFDFSFLSGKEEVANTEIPATEPTEETDWGFLLIAFLAGLAAIVTPCVFPMIPMTVSFFMHGEEEKKKGIRKGLLFGFSIIAIYTIFGSVMAVVFGADFGNFLSTHWLPNILFFLIFVFFAASFFGMFEITLPNWMISKSDQKADQGGWAGPFFMALTTVLVSFACTGPIVGSLVFQSAGGEILKPIMGMLAFGIAFALPFTLFAVFPHWLAKLPQSGGWLNNVKVILGFIELALGLKFLSVADQTYHWGLLDREIYLAFWIVIFTLMAFYLLGKIKFAHDSDVPHVGVPKLIMAIATFTFVVYLVPGMFGAPLKALSGYLPPQHTHDFDLNEIIRTNAEMILLEGKDVTELDSKQAMCEKPKYGDDLHLPHGLTGYFEYEQGLICAKEQGKPIFIDFTGHGCVNCREMEASVWSDPRVLKLLREEFVIIALYVDDKTIKLPENEWYKPEGSKRTIKKLGKKNTDFQQRKYEVNSQPYYVILNHEEKQMVKAHSYDKNVQHFIDFLTEGLKKFKSQQIPESTFSFEN